MWVKLGSPLRGRAGGVILCEESPGGKALE